MRRTAILQVWRSTVDDDPQLATASSLPRAQFYDHIPGVLDTFQRKLQARPAQQGDSAEEKQDEDAASHGLVRWQQGFHLREVTREWGYLHLCLLDELEDYASAHPDLEPGVMPWRGEPWRNCAAKASARARRNISTCSRSRPWGNSEDLEHALEHSRRLEEQRVRLLYEAAHDLRGNLGTVVNASTCLNLENISESVRGFLLRSLQQSVTALHSMLDDVMDLARLEAGQAAMRETVRCRRPLRGLCEDLQPLAGERGLFLKAAGPTTFPVEGDAGREPKDLPESPAQRLEIHPRRRRDGDLGR